jgi:cysteine desulfurase/selenocysteine lyase
MAFDVQKIRQDFPILHRQVNGQELVYFDNAATAQTPQPVIDAIVDYYSTTNANIHRGVHALSQEATEAYEAARQKIQKHFNAANPYEIILTSGTTEAINCIASGYASILQPGDEVIVSAMEHHSNIVPWQMLCEKTGAQLKVLPMLQNGTLDMEAYAQLLNARTQLVFVNHVSNALGTVNPVASIISQAHAVGAKVLIDGAQATPHYKVDVQALAADFYVTSAHKICGPTGVGMLYGKAEHLRELPPYQGGGEMIAEVTFEKTTYADLPHKFEAGTPNIAGGIAFGAALDYVNSIGLEAIATYEASLLAYATAALEQLPGITIYAKDVEKVAVLSFTVQGLHPYDVGSILDTMGIAVRTGHHCAQPIMDYYEIPGTIRASFAFYNTKEEIDRMVEALKKAITMLQ